MTAALPFTQAAVRRAVEGVKSAGLTVAAVHIDRDGSIVVHTNDAPSLASFRPLAQPADSVSRDKWSDA
jgi:hypothetical protein